MCTLAALLMSLGSLTPANAVVLTVSPNNFTMTNPGGAVVTVPGLPAWFQGADGVAIQPCVGDPIKCALAGSPNYFGGPVSYPTNFPEESFYTLADANFVMAGASDVLVIMALEYVFVDVNGALVAPTVPGSVGSVFQRLKVVHTFIGGGGDILALGAPANGTYTVTTPWGVTVFPASGIKCVNQGGDTKCTMVRDISPTAVFAAPDSGMYTFLKDPAAPVGFLGIGGGVASYTGSPIARNSVSVIDPMGRTATNSQLSILTGQTIGMEVQPGVNHDFGAVNMNTPPALLATKSIKVTNRTGFPILFAADLNGILVKTGADLNDFIIGPPTAVPALINCSGATLAAANAAAAPPVPAGICGFDITFKPVVAAKGLRKANIHLAPTAVPAAPANDPPAVDLTLSGTAQVTVTTAVAIHGTITPDATVVPIAGSLVNFAAPAGSPVTFTVTPSSKKFKVKLVEDVAGAAAAVPVVAPFTINTSLANHVVTATFMQSGDLNVDGKVDVADALVALKIVAGIPQAPDPLDLNNSAVKVAPLDVLGPLGQPAALDANPTANPGIGDVLVILRRALNLEAW